MGMTTIPLNDADASQLREYAESIGLEVKLGSKKSDIINMLMMASPEIASIDVNDGVTDDAPKAAPVKMGVRGAVPTCVIEIQKPAGENAEHCAFLGHNGRGYQINFDVEVEIPYYLLNVLKDARQVIVTQEPGPNPLQVVTRTRERSAYSYSVITPPDAALVKEWEAQTSSQFSPA
jgi:hypothetical protein